MTGLLYRVFWTPDGGDTTEVARFLCKGDALAFAQRLAVAPSTSSVRVEHRNKRIARYQHVDPDVDERRYTVD